MKYIGPIEFLYTAPSQNIKVIPCDAFLNLAHLQFNTSGSTSGTTPRGDRGGGGGLSRGVLRIPMRVVKGD